MRKVKLETMPPALLFNPPPASLPPMTPCGTVELTERAAPPRPGPHRRPGLPAGERAGPASPHAAGHFDGIDAALPATA